MGGAPWGRKLHLRLLRERARQGASPIHFEPCFSLIYTGDIFPSTFGLDHGMTARLPAWAIYLFSSFDGLARHPRNAPHAHVMDSDTAC
jgi:hypothetical protein